MFDLYFQQHGEAHPVWHKKIQIHIFIVLQVPWWPDEIVFEKTRAIVIAMMQKVMFNDWLPIILGRETAFRSGLFVSRFSTNITRV